MGLLAPYDVYRLGLLNKLQVWSVDLQTITNRFWNEELGSSVVDWAIFGAGIGSLGLAVITTLL